MKTSFSPKNNPRVIIIQKLYGKFYNNDEQLTYPKHRFKKFIKDIVSGTIEPVSYTHLTLPTNREV